MPTRVTVIINPFAGARRGESLPAARAALARRVLAEHGVDVDVAITARAGHASSLAREAVDHGASIVVAWGGDGTVNEVASALAFGPAALALVPSGSGNGLARALGVPTAPDAALRHALERPARAVDMGELGGRLFVNVAGIGLDAAVAARFGRSRTRGFLSHLRTAMPEFFSYVPVEYHLDVDGDRLRITALIVALANSSQYGNGVTIAPDARLDDGRLDLVLVGPIPVFSRIVGAPRLFTGSIDRVRGVTIRPMSRLRISAAGPMPFHVDGEPATGDATLEASVHPGALRIKA